MSEKLVGPVSEIYTPEVPGRQLIDVPADERSIALKYSAAFEVDADGKDVPDIDDAGNFRGNTAIYRLPESGNTGVSYVSTENHMARYTVRVVTGGIRVIKNYSSGYVQDLNLSEGDSVVFKQGEAFSFVNTSKEDVLLHSEAYPACQNGDIVAMKPATAAQVHDERLKERRASEYWIGGKPDGSLITAQLAHRFSDTIHEASASKSRLKAIYNKTVNYFSSRRSG